MKFNAYKEQYELKELEVMFSKKTIEESELSNSSENKHSPKQSLKSNSSINSKVEYKLVDEMSDDSVLKEKCVNISIGERDFKFNLIWLDKKTFVHVSQMLDLANYNEENFIYFLNNNDQFYKKFSQYKNDVLITKFLNKSQNLPIFNWLNFTLGIDNDDLKETYFVVYENLGKLIRKLCSPSFSKLVDDAFISKKKNRRQTSLYELNQKVTYFEKQIELLNKQIRDEVDKNSSENQQANFLLNKLLDVKKDYLNVIDNLY